MPFTVTLSAIPSITRSSEYGILASKSYPVRLSISSTDALPVVTPGQITGCVRRGSPDCNNPRLSGNPVDIVSYRSITMTFHMAEGTVTLPPTMVVAVPLSPVPPLPYAMIYASFQSAISFRVQPSSTFQASRLSFGACERCWS